MSKSQQEKKIQNQKTRRRRRKHRRLSAFAWILIVCVLLVSAGVFAANRYLKVTQVEISGKSKYTNSQILSAAHIKAGDRVFSLNREKSAERIVAQLPYVQSAQVKLCLFTRVKITVVQDTAYFLVKVKDGYAVCDNRLKVLEIAKDQSAFSQLPAVSGVEVTNYAAGTKLTAKTAATLDHAMEIYDGIKKNKIEKVKTIDVSDSYELTFNYDSRITVLVGTYAQLDEKLWYAAKMLSDKNNIRDTDKGTLDVSQSAQKSKVSFIPS